jgi:hypothetical protein
VTGQTNSFNFPVTPGAFQTESKDFRDAFVAKLNAGGSALDYSTYLGGIQLDVATGIAVDGAGDAYVTGRTESRDFPTTPGAFQTLGNGLDDAFVTELNPSGSALVYSTYLTGSRGSSGRGIVVDAGGHAFVTGTTASNDFPTTPGAFQTVNKGGANGGGDAFVVKFNPAGSALEYGTFLGGSGFDDGNAIAVDPTGNAYVAGNTGSADFPATAGAFDTTYNGGGSFGDAFIAKLNPAGSALAYASYLGGTDDDYGYGVAVDGAGHAYVTGQTLSPGYPTTPGAFQTTYGGGIFDAFVTQMSADGSSLVYSTFLGGSDWDGGAGIAVDAAGHAFVTGQTKSTDFPTTPGAFEGTAGGDFDAFLAELNTSGGSLVYGTYLGAPYKDFGYAVALDGSGSVYLAGATQSPNFPTTPGAFQTHYGGGDQYGGDAFVTKFCERACRVPAVPHQAP